MSRREEIVALPEEVDIRNAADVADELTLAVSRSSVVIIDMTATMFCDCAGARAILRAHKRATRSGAELRLVATATLVRRILGLMGVDRLLYSYPSVEAARGATPQACLTAGELPAGYLDARGRVRRMQTSLLLAAGEYVPAFVAGLGVQNPGAGGVWPRRAGLGPPPTMAG